MVTLQLPTLHLMYYIVGPAHQIVAIMTETVFESEEELTLTKGLK